jgi:hypothetical protein
MSPADAVRLGEALERLVDSLAALAASRARTGPPVRVIVISSLLPAGCHFATAPGSALDLSFVTMSPTQWEMLERATMANGAYLKAAALGERSPSFNGLPVFDMDRADAGRDGAAAMARAEAIRHAIAEDIWRNRQT